LGLIGFVFPANQIAQFFVISFQIKAYVHLGLGQIGFVLQNKPIGILLD